MKQRVNVATQTIEGVGMREDNRSQGRAKGPFAATCAAVLAGARSLHAIRVGADRIEMEVVDILAANEEILTRLRRQVGAVLVAACRERAVPTKEEVDAYLDRVLDRGRLDRYDTVVLFHGPQGPFGFAHGHARRRSLRGREVEVIGMGTFFDPDYQGLGLMSTAFSVLALRYAHRRLLVRCPRYVVGVALNPATYYFAHRRTRRFYPSPIHTDDGLLAELCDLDFPSETRDEGVIAVAFAPRIDDRIRAWLARSEDPLVRFYIERNPRFEDGFVLPYAAPLGLVDFLYGVGMHIRLAMRRGSGRSA